MKKSVYFVMITLMLVVLSLSVSAMSGEGTAENPYIISNAQDLVNVKNDLSAHYRLSANIDMSSVSNFKPIGNENDGPFTGSIDGNGKTISNLKINYPKYKYVGFIGYNEGDVSNLSLNNVKINGGRYTGGITGYNSTDCEIEGCTVSGEVKSENGLIEVYVGGIVGYNNGIISSCNSTASVIAEAEEATNYAGGFIGYNVTDGLVLEEIDVSNKVYSLYVAGSYIGYNLGDNVEFISCGSNSEVNGVQVGGYIGINGGENLVLNTCNNNSIVFLNCIGGSYGYAGGYIGNNYYCKLSFISCQNNSKVHSLSEITSFLVAGYLGCKSYGEVNFDNCKNNAECSSEDTVAGYIALSYGSVSFNKCENDSNLSKTSNYACDFTVGGFIARVEYGSVIFTECKNYTSIVGTFSLGSYDYVHAGGFVAINFSNEYRIDVLKSVNYGKISIKCNTLSWISGFFASTSYTTNINIDECVNAGDIYLYGAGEAAAFITRSNSKLNSNSISDSYNTGRILSSSNGGDNESGVAVISNQHNTYNLARVQAVSGKTGRASAYGATYNLEKSFSALDYISASNPLSVDQLKDINTFESWDFKNVWAINSKYNSGFPYLRCFENNLMLNETFITDATIGDSIKLIAYKNGVELNDVTWKCSDGAVVTGDGVVTINSSGMIRVFAESKDGEVQTCSIYSYLPHSVTDVEIDNIGSMETYKCSGFSEYPVSVQSDKPEIASAYVRGNQADINDTHITLYAFAKGTATITFTTNLNNTYSFDVISKAEVKEVRISEDGSNYYSERISLSLPRGSEKQLYAAVSPAGSVPGTITFTSSDDSIVSVTADGKILAKKAGTANIYATSTNGKSQYFTVSVTNGTENVTIARGNRHQLYPNVLADGSDADNINYISSNEIIASVSSDGLVTANNIGTATITVDSNGILINTYYITVNAPATDIRLSSVNLPMVIGTTATLKATPTPLDTTDSISYSSSNTSCVTVNSTTGLVTAVKNGTATITVNAGSKRAYCVVTVVAEPVAVEGVELSDSELYLHKTEQKTLVSKVLPADATDIRVKWASLNEEVATVDEFGTVTGIEKGETTITATTFDGEFIAECKVTVVVGVENVIINLGESVQLSSAIYPLTASNKDVIWESENEDIVTVNEDGVITANNYGTVNIIVTTADGNKSASCTVVVAKPVENIVFEKDTFDIALGNTKQLSATIYPSDATDISLKYTSSNDSVVSVDEAGNIKAEGVGTAIITAVANNGKTATIIVRVTSFNGAIYSDFEYELIEDETAVKILSYHGEETNIIIPEKMGDLTVEAIGKDLLKNAENVESVFIPESVQNIEPGSLGAEQIKVICYENSPAHAFAVNNGFDVEFAVKISITADRFDVAAGSTLQLVADISPESHMNDKLIWSSDNTDIATVNAEGLVKAKSVGNVTISVSNGSVNASVIIEVTEEIHEHSFGPWEVVKEASCIAVGEEKRVCTDCEYAETRTIEKTNHVVIIVVDSEATCTAEGVQHKECKVCHETLETEAIEKKAHTPSEWIVDTEATCIEEGSKHKECTVCNETLETEAIDKVEHTQSDWIVDTEPTCIEEGSKHKECTVCHETLETEAIAMVEHTPSEWLTDTEPTCIEEGSKHKECTVCHETLETEAIAMVEHTPETALGKEPTCAEEGLTDGTICSACGETLAEQQVIPATGDHHDNDHNGRCDTCDKDTTEGCDCRCHKDGFAGFIYKITRIFWKIFRKNQICQCGVSHY